MFEVRDGYTENIDPLVDKTKEVVKNHLDDVWLLWARAQRASLPLKIEACSQ
jgi:hypothetical protein